MLLRNALKSLKFDKRLQEYNISKGTLSENDFSSFINSLEDLSGRAEPLLFKEDRQKAKAEASAPSQQQSQPQQAAPNYGEAPSWEGSAYGGGTSNGDRQGY